MLIARGAFLVFLAIIAGLFVRAGYRRDRVLGHIMLAGVVLYVCGVFLMGWYLHDIRGRDYLAPDEVAFQIDGQRRLLAWQTSSDYVPILPGGYPIWNGIVIGIWGVSPVPMRLANAVAGVISIFVAYLLARQLFEGVRSARIAALLVLLSPSLAIWTFNNVKERPLSLFVTVAVLMGVRLLQRWSRPRCAGFALSIYALAVMRHYYAGILAWLLLGWVIVLAGHWRQRALRGAAVLLLVGCALQLATGSFMLLSLRGETIMRYVAFTDRQPEAAPPAAEAKRSRSIEEEIPLPRTDGLSLMGDTMGAGEVAGRRSIGELTKSSLFVMFGRFTARGSAGRVMEWILMPEWLLAFALWPLAGIAVYVSVKQGQTPILLPAAFIAALVALLGWTHGDDWTTIRFRSVCWPELLVLAAGGFPIAWQWLQERAARRNVPAALRGQS